MIETEKIIMSIFQDLVSITKPLGVQNDAEGYSLIFKSYTRMVEKFLRNIKLEMIIRKLSWSQVFHMYMTNTGKVISRDRYVSSFTMCFHAYITPSSF